MRGIEVMNQEPPETGSAVRRRNEIKRTFMQRVGDWLFGYDFFISYCWKDGRTYAVELANQLTKNGYACFLDSTDYAKGDDWKLVGERALRHSSQCVLVSTHGARQSKPVLREINIFRQLGRRIVPIQFDNSLFDDGEPCELRELLPSEILRISEQVEQLDSGPSTEAVQDIIRGFTKQTQEQKRTKFFAATSVIFAVLSLLAITFWVQAVRAKNEAVKLNASSIYDLGQFACSASRERLGLLQLAKGVEICRESQLAMTQTYEQSLSLWTKGLATPVGYIPSGTAMPSAIEPVAVSLDHAVIATVRLLSKEGGIAFDFFDLPALTPSLRYPPVTLNDLNSDSQPVFSLDFSDSGVLCVAWLNQPKLNINEKLTGDLCAMTFDPQSAKRSNFQFNNVEIDRIKQSPNNGFLATIDSAGLIKFWRTDGNKLVTFVELEFRGRLTYIASTEPPAPMPFENWVLSMDGRLLAIEHDDRLVRVWNTSDGTLHSVIETPQDQTEQNGTDLATQEWGTSIIFSDADRRIWTCSDGKIRCWASKDGTLLGGADNTGIDIMKSVSTDGRWIVGEYQHNFQVSRHGYELMPAAKLFEVLRPGDYASELRLRQVVLGFFDADLHSLINDAGPPSEDLQYQPPAPPAPEVEATEDNDQPPVPRIDEVPPTPNRQDIPPAPEAFEAPSTPDSSAGKKDTDEIDYNFEFISTQQDVPQSFPLDPPRLLLGNSPVPVIRDVALHPSKPLAIVQFDSGGQVWDLSIGRQTLAKSLSYEKETALVAFGSIVKDIIITTGFTGTRSFVVDEHSLLSNTLLRSRHFQSDQDSGLVYTCSNPFCVSPDGKLLVEYATDSLKLWDFQAFKENGLWHQLGKTLDLDGWDVHSVAFSPDSGSFIAIAFKDKGFFPLFETEDAKIIRVSVAGCTQVGESPVVQASQLSISEDARFVVGNVSLDFGDLLMSEQTDVKMYDMHFPDKSPTTFSQKGIVNFAVLSPNAELLFTAADNRVAFWEVSSQEMVFELAHSSNVDELVCFDEGNKLFVATEAGSMRVWNVKSKTPQFAEIAHMHQSGFGKWFKFAVSQDGSCFATGGDEWIRLWNTETGKQIGPDIPASGAVTEIEFVRNDHFLAIQTDDQRTTFLQIWTRPPGSTMQALWIERITAASLNSSGTLVPTLKFPLDTDFEADELTRSTLSPINIIPLDSDRVEDEPGPGNNRFDMISWPESDTTPAMPPPVIDPSA